MTLLQGDCEEDSAGTTAPEKRKEYVARQRGLLRCKNQTVLYACSPCETEIWTLEKTARQGLSASETSFLWVVEEMEREI